MADVSEKDRVLHQAAMLKHAQNRGALDPEYASIMLLQGAYYGDIPLVVHCWSAVCRSTQPTKSQA
jgi:predicted protein tyrosine phosphatase